jgi:hypothetical protein
MIMKSDPKRYFQSQDYGTTLIPGSRDDDFEFDVITKYLSFVFTEIRVNEINIV